MTTGKAEYSFHLPAVSPRVCVVTLTRFSRVSHLLPQDPQEHGVPQCAGPAEESHWRTLRHMLVGELAANAEVLGGKKG